MPWYIRNTLTGLFLATHEGRKLTWESQEQATEFNGGEVPPHLENHPFVYPVDMVELDRVPPPPPREACPNLLTASREEIEGAVHAQGIAQLAEATKDLWRTRQQERMARAAGVNRFLTTGPGPISTLIELGMMSRTNEVTVQDLGLHILARAEQERRASAEQENTALEGRTPAEPRYRVPVLPAPPGSLLYQIMEDRRRERADLPDPYAPGFWTTQEGDRLRISEMSLSHLTNVHRMLLNNGRRPDKLAEIRAELDRRGGETE